MSLGDGTSDG